MMERLGKESGLISKLRHYVARKNLFNYYKLQYISNHSLWYPYLGLLQQMSFESHAISSEKNSKDDLLQVQARSL